MVRGHVRRPVHSRRAAALGSEGPAVIVVTVAIDVAPVTAGRCRPGGRRRRPGAPSGGRTSSGAATPGRELRPGAADGLGEVPGLLLGLFISPVVMFTIPYETEQMYQREGRQSPVSTLWGLWFLLPFIGWIIWYPKVQRALNEFWISKGSQSAA
jgi:hypothetical protein